MDDEPSSPDRTPIILGLLAFVLAACLHWLPDVVGAQKAPQLQQPAATSAMQEMTT